MKEAPHPVPLPTTASRGEGDNFAAGGVGRLAGAWMVADLTIQISEKLTKEPKEYYERDKVGFDLERAGAGAAQVIWTLAPRKQGAVRRLKNAAKWRSR